jgi:hypothetical protein
LLQVYENYCRDEFFLKDDLANKVVEQGLVNLDQLTCLEFSTLFARLGSVSYKMMKPVFDNYGEVFDIYVCDDAKEAK